MIGNLAKWTLTQRDYLSSIRSLPSHLHSISFRVCISLPSAGLKEATRHRAEKIYRLILKIDERVDGIDCGEVVLSSFDLAQILANSGRYMEAEHQYLETINRCTQSLGQDHPIFALTLNSYSVLLRKMKMDEQAASMEQRVQEMSQGGEDRNPEYGSYTAPEKKESARRPWAENKKQKAGELLLSFRSIGKHNRDIYTAVG